MIMKNIYLILFFICSIGFAQGQQYKIPDIDWKDSTQYAQFTDIVLNNINWAYQTPMTTLKNTRKEVNSFLIQWIGGTPTMNITLNADVIKCNNHDLVAIFTFGWAKYALENNDNDVINGCLYGIDYMLSFYENNAPFFGKNKQINKLKKWKNKGVLQQRMTKHYLH